MSKSNTLHYKKTPQHIIYLPLEKTPNDNLTLRRTTIMLDEDILKRLRLHQAKIIKKNTSSVSLSQIINEYLAFSIKNNKI